MKMEKNNENNYEALSTLKPKINEEQFNHCINNCNKIDKKGEVLYCTDKACRSHKKRINTRRKNIAIRSKWNVIESKINLSQNSLYENTSFPYLMLEAIIEHIYDEDVKKILSYKLGVSISKLKTEGLTNLYKLSGIDVKSIIEITVLRMIGLNRAEQIVKTKIK